MASLRYTLRCLRDFQIIKKSQWSLAAARLAYRPKVCTRAISTTPSRSALLENNNSTKRSPPATSQDEDGDRDGDQDDNNFEWPSCEPLLKDPEEIFPDQQKYLRGEVGNHDADLAEFLRQKGPGDKGGEGGQTRTAFDVEHGLSPADPTSSENEYPTLKAIIAKAKNPNEPPADFAEIVYARPFPVSPSYFSRTPTFNDAYVVVQDLARKYWKLPTVPKDQLQRVAWRSRVQYRQAVGEHVKGRDYAECMKLVKRLHQIHPDLMPEEVKEGLHPFKREVSHFGNTPKVLPIDRFGRSHGVGKRKESIARAWIVEGTGEVLINGKPLTEAFGRVHDRESAVWGLKLTDRIDKYNIWALVEGGGTTGQAEALALAISKALIVHEPALKNPLRRAGCMTRDPRAVERKKHGHVKARKMPTWVKR